MINHVQTYGKRRDLPKFVDALLKELEFSQPLKNIQQHHQNGQIEFEHKKQ
jgi:hypothetical protein